MKGLKMTLVDNDDKIQAKADLGLDGDEMDAVSSFISRLKEELVSGQTAHLEIEGDSDDTVRLAVTRSE